MSTLNSSEEAIRGHLISKFPVGHALNAMTSVVAHVGAALEVATISDLDGSKRRRLSPSHEVADACGRGVWRTVDGSPSGLRADGAIDR